MRKSGHPASVVPKQIKPGDTIGVIAPGSSITREKLELGCASLHSLGYKTFFLDSILDRDTYFAGNHRRRAGELEQMFLRDDITGIICARGGYGCNHLLPLIDLEIVQKHPKMFMGYSDATTLLTWFADQTDMVTYHGPMVVSDFANGGQVVSFESPLRFETTAAQPRMGTAKGVLYGGCLSMLVASLGTPYEIETDNTILFIEDINTKPFQIDRMLTQLKLAGKLESVRGFVFGEMVGCVQPGGQDYSLQDVVVRVLGDLNVPIAFGLHSGHVSSLPNHTLPIGVKAALQVDEFSASLTF